jgi:hypothetical protein
LGSASGPQWRELGAPAFQLVFRFPVMAARDPDALSHARMHLMTHCRHRGVCSISRGHDEDPMTHSPACLRSARDDCALHHVIDQSGIDLSVNAGGNGIAMNKRAGARRFRAMPRCFVAALWRF